MRPVNELTRDQLIGEHRDLRHPMGRKHQSDTERQRLKEVKSELARRKDRDENCDRASEGVD